MNQLRRIGMVLSPKTMFTRNSQRLDFLNGKVTSDKLAAVACHIIDKGWYFQFTSVNSDHHSDLKMGSGQHGHTIGNAFDGWPSTSRNLPADYVLGASALMVHFLGDLLQCPHVVSVGLAGTSFNAPNLAALATLGGLAFEDEGADHIHIAV